MSRNEKQLSESEITHHELPTTGTVSEKSEEHPDIARFSPKERTKILRRIDWRLLPMVGLLYFISLMDRTNCL